MFLHVTTHLPNRPHDNLLETVGGRIFFPSFFVLDAEGEVVGRHTGDRSVPGFVATMREAAEFVDLRAKAAAGDRRAAVALLLARARMGRLTAAALEAEMAKHELDAAQRKVYRGVLADFMLEDVQRTAVGRAFLEMEKDDLVPADAAKRSFFYAQIFPYGAQTGDVALMERCLGELEAAWGQEPAHEATLAGLRKQIEQAKARRREAADQEKR